MKIQFCCPLVYAALAIGLASCGLGERVEITETRTATKHRPLPVVVNSELERLGIQQNPLSWDTPEGWEARAQSQMRIVNYAFGEGGSGECYVTILPQGGGGVVPNINRWYGQMGLDAPTDLSGVEMRPLMGAEAYFIDISGDYSGVGAADPVPNQRMLGLVQDFGQFIIFVKSIGPAEVMAGEVENFHAFCESLNIRR